ncbi:pantetheine-phosphate adenylyltransferase family protein [Ophiostoma piceae UAMH 11346]|uniref:Pantetheine-phosphate adenylyltransferase family protein n=1 Tax=Ophiostoma piceae (strain UAMH 11346) TaxID=1262450 RepID=S3CVM4_OPHP1|nr:pantetheine-phosphate adenylyltransferase family protein [Ophiostoma piceae UAMH 11346]
MAHGKATSLVLLPAPPEPPSPESLSAAYRPALEMALPMTSNKAKPAVLIVAVSYPSAENFVWGDAQELLAGLYSLIVVLCKEQQIETGMDDGPGSVDARVVLLDSGTSGTSSSTAFVDLPSLAATHSSWDSVFYPESKAGLQLRDQFLTSASQVYEDKVVAVAGGLTLRTGAATETAGASPTLTTLHKTVCLGGTFDYLHLGHKLLLTAGALLLRVPPPSSLDNAQKCEYVIGITGDELLRKKKYAELVQSWSTRARAVADFLATILDLPAAQDPSSNSKIEEKDGELRTLFRNGSVSLLCVRINDGFGPTIEREDITCLVVSGETRSGGEAVNKKREEQGWQPLETFVVDVLNADGMAAVKDRDSKDSKDKPTATESFDAKISSSEIRRRRAERGLMRST